MSLLDIRNAKAALTWRLKEWGIEDDPARLAASFIDDLVEKGWRMDAMREDRPQPPKVSDACLRCGLLAGTCACTREYLADNEPAVSPDLPPPSPSLAARLARITNKETPA